MIVIFIDNIENFIEFLERKRLVDDLFYEFKEIKQPTEFTSANDVEIVLHFLSKIEEFLVLFETKLVITQSS
ncbi:MAG: hypothetical protein ACFE8P_02085, partial [Promethearchaeota archaeon]